MQNPKHLDLHQECKRRQYAYLAKSSIVPRKPIQLIVESARRLHEEERHNLEAQPGVSGNLVHLSQARYPFSWLRLAFEFGVNCLLSMTSK